jgi:acyl carrier protein
MDKQQTRLAGCFLTVFPELRADEIVGASTASVGNWDSVAGVALIAAVEEQFGINIEIDDLARFNSFKGFLDYLHESETGHHVSGDRGTYGHQ